MMRFFTKYIESAWKLLTRNKVIFENFSWITIMQVLSLVFPLLIYPYLTRTLGTELYGLVITASILSSYCSIITDFGFRSISARYVSIHRDDKERLSEIICSILVVQFILWILCFILYLGIICLIPTYRQHFLLFFFSFFLTFLNLLFPQYYFQGVEKMRYITIIQLTFQIIFLMLIFFVIKEKSDYIYVPLLQSIGYLLGGGYALYIIFIKDGIKLKMPQWKDIKYYTKDATPIFLTDVICTIKDKLNYLLLGSIVNMSQVVIYDVGSKIHHLMLKPLQVISTVIFPKMARDKNDKQFTRIGIMYFAIVFVLFVIVNIFLPTIVKFLIGQNVDLFPIRLYIVSPLFLGVSSYISKCFFIARGYNKYILYSIIVTTVVYVVSLIVFYVLGLLNTVTTFVGVTVISYFAELIYRLIMAKKLGLKMS